MEQPANFDVAINHNIFKRSLIKLLKIIENKSEFFMTETEKNNDCVSEFRSTKVYNAHLKLQNACKIISTGFSDKSDNFDQGKIIKKIYKMLTANLDKFFPNPDVSLFYLKNDKNEAITIIPGIDIKLVVKSKYTTNNDMEEIWGNMYMVYISAANMIGKINENKKNATVTEIIPKMRQKVIEMKMMQEDDFFNPFIGLNVETGEYDVETMRKNIENMPAQDENSINNLIKMSGLEKTLDMKGLTEQLINIDDESIDNVTKTVVGLLDAKNDKNTEKICGDLIKKIVSGVKENPNMNMLEMTVAASEHFNKEMNGENKKQYNAMRGHFDKFLNNGQLNLKNLKDNDGNLIGDQLMKSLEMPLQMAKMMSQNKK